MEWMNGIPGVDCHMLEARTDVVEQEGWEISILSQLRTELMCHLALLTIVQTTRPLYAATA